jgi:hypothetical protein
MQGFRASAHGHDEDGAKKGGLRAGDRVEMLAKSSISQDDQTTLGALSGTDGEVRPLVRHQPARE